MLCCAVCAHQQHEERELHLRTFLHEKRQIRNKRDKESRRYLKKNYINEEKINRDPYFRMVNGNFISAYHTPMLLYGNNLPSVQRQCESHPSCFIAVKLN